MIFVCGKTCGQSMNLDVKIHAALPREQTFVRFFTFWTAHGLQLTAHFHCPSTQLKISGTTMVASLSTMNFGVFAPSLPQVIFSFGTAPE